MHQKWGTSFLCESMYYTTDNTRTLSFINQILLTLHPDTFLATNTQSSTKTTCLKAGIFEYSAMVSGATLNLPGVPQGSYSCSASVPFDFSILTLLARILHLDNTIERMKYLSPPHERPPTWPPDLYHSLWRLQHLWRRSTCQNRVWCWVKCDDYEVADRNVCNIRPVALMHVRLLLSTHIKSHNLHCLLFHFVSVCLSVVSWTSVCVCAC